MAIVVTLPDIVIEVAVTKRQRHHLWRTSAKDIECFSDTYRLETGARLPADTGTVIHLVPDKIIEEVDETVEVEIENMLDQQINVYVDSYFLEGYLRKETQVVIMEPGEEKTIELLTLLDEPNMSMNITKIDHLKII